MPKEEEVARWSKCSTVYDVEERSRMIKFEKSHKILHLGGQCLPYQEPLPRRGRDKDIVGMGAE